MCIGMSWAYGRATMWTARTATRKCTIVTDGKWSNGVLVMVINKVVDEEQTL